MSDLQNLLDRRRIPFLKSLNQEQVEDLFEYLAKGDIEVNYQLETRGVMSNNNPKKFFKQKYCSKIFGRMTDISLKTGYASSLFDCSTEPPKILDEEIGQIGFSDIHFSIIPGYSLEEHNEKEIQLWDKIRELTQKYFSSKE